jgi:hypothetical protein
LFPKLEIGLMCLTLNLTLCTQKEKASNKHLASG